VNYEIGLRLTSPERTLEFDTTAFFIDWTNIQLRLNRPDGFAYVANAGDAHSKGLENSLSWRPVGGLALQASLTYLEAALAKSLNLGNGTTLPSGAVLPGASKWSTSETAEYRFSGRLRPHILLSHRYLSKAYGDFSPELPVGDYHIVDLRGGVDVGQWGITAFVNNIGNRRGVTAAAYFGEQLTDYYVMPRTIGLQLDWRL
jgi:iron complex outermembrane recepter protein